MASQITDVTDVDEEVIPRHPLNIQSLIQCIGKLIRPVVIRKNERRRAVNYRGPIGHRNLGWIAARRRPKRRAIGIVEGASVGLCGIAGRNEAQIKSSDGRTNLVSHKWLCLVD